jgi:hypothetical protein
MNFKKLTDQAKAAIDKRGGTEALKRDFKEVAQSKGTFKDKAKAAGDRLKQPGAGRPGGPGAGPADTPPTAQDLPPRA